VGLLTLPSFGLWGFSASYYSKKIKLVWVELQCVCKSIHIFRVSYWIRKSFKRWLHAPYVSIIRIPECFFQFQQVVWTAGHT
jgi:hypothetical protein